MDETNKATLLLGVTNKREGKEEFSVIEVETNSPITHWVECSRFVKLTALISNRAVSLIELLEIRAVNLTDLFPF